MCGAGSRRWSERPAPRLLSLSSSPFYPPGAACCQQSTEAKDGHSTSLGCTSLGGILPFAQVSAPIVQEMLGHANIRQTMDTYSHVLPNMQLQAAERMDEMLG